MELRKEESKDIQTMELDVRHLANAAFQSGRTARNVTDIAGRSLGAGGRAISGGKALAKSAALAKEDRAALAYLSREQRKQWNSYSHREQKRILKTVERKVERRTRQGFTRENDRPATRGRMSEEDASKYRVPQSPRGKGTRIREACQPAPAPEQRRMRGYTASEPKLGKGEIRAVTGPRVKKAEARTVTGSKLRRTETRAVTGPKIREAEARAGTVPRIRKTEARTVTGPKIREAEARTVTGSKIRKMETRAVTGPKIRKAEIRTATGQSVKDIKGAALKRTAPGQKPRLNEKAGPKANRELWTRPDQKREWIALIRQNRARKAFHNITPPPPHIRSNETSGQARRKWENISRGLVSVDRARKEIPAAGNKGIALRTELDYLASGNRGHRHEVSQTIRAGRGKRGVSRQRTDIFYESDPDKAAKKVLRIERKQRKEVRCESAKQKRIYHEALVSILDQDARKADRMKQARRADQVEAALAAREQETRASVMRTATLPARIKLALIRSQMKEIAVKAAVALAKYLALAVIPIFLCLVLFLFLAALMGGIAGEEEEQEKYNAAYSVSGYEIVDYAKEWIGVTKYVWGAGRGSATDWQDYADCSSFVYGVFAHFGIAMGTTTYTQENAGTLVEGGLKNAMPGDIILFYSGSISAGNSSHVGIYAGDGKMVHCSGGSANTYSNPGKGVCVGDVQGDGRPFVVRRLVQPGSGGGEELLSILAKYNARLESDIEKGVKWYYSNSGTASTWSGATGKGKKATNCALLVRWAMKEMGVIAKSDFWYYTYDNKFKMSGNTEARLKANTEIIEARKTAGKLIAAGTLQPGDICCWHNIRHVNVYAGSNKWYDAGRGGAGHYEGSTYYFDKWGPISTNYLNSQVDYIIRIPSKAASGNGTSSGHRRDTTSYTQSQKELIWAIVAQEDNGSYAGALAVISSAMNRTESASWKSLGGSALAQLTAPGQYCYSNDSYWKKWLNGNVPDYVKQAVDDCLTKGIRNHDYTSFRSQKGSQTGPNAVQIGGNWFFGS